MDVFPEPGAGWTKHRMHPYLSSRPGEAGFVDFRQQPERIPEVLEDYRPHADQPAVRTFFEFLRWINGPESVLETCDCALQGPDKVKSPKESRFPWVLHGRVMMMHREPGANCIEGAPTIFIQHLYGQLQRVDALAPLRDVSAGLSLCSVLYRDRCLAQPAADGTLAAGPYDPGLGQHVMVTFRAHGHSHPEVWQKLYEFYGFLWIACRRTSDHFQPLGGFLPVTPDAATTTCAGHD